MAEELSPYDTGKRLEPHVWVRDKMVSPNGETRPAEIDEYGRVDFDADGGTTILTLFIEPTDGGYQMSVEQSGDDYLTIVGANQPPVLRGPAAEVDLDYRERQMMLLDAGLQQIAADFADHVTFFHGDPLTFSPGNFVFYPGEDTQAWFAVEELYEHCDDWADFERVPIGWEWHEAGPVVLPDGSIDRQRVAEGTTIPSDIEHLLERARAWAQGVANRATESDTPALTQTVSNDPHRNHPDR